MRTMLLILLRRRAPGNPAGGNDGKTDIGRRKMCGLSSLCRRLSGTGNFTRYKGSEKEITVNDVMKYPTQ